MLGCRRGIAHSELSINNRTDLHGVQLWTALPEHSRNIEPSFDHYADLPVFEWNEMGVRLFIGGFLGNSSPAKSFSPIVGAEIDLPAGSSTDLPAIGSFEYGVLVVSGQTSVNGHSVNLGQLHYIPAGNQTLLLASPNGAKLILLGGEPFEEKIVMWWNFIGRSHRRAHSRAPLAKFETQAARKPFFGIR